MEPACSLVSPIIFTDQGNNGTETRLSSYREDDEELIIWREDYWRQMSADFKQLKLYDFSWLEPIKDATCQAECILQQILYPGIHTSDKATRWGTAYRPPDMLDEVLDKLRNITHSSAKLIQLFRPFDEGTTSTSM